MFSLTPVRFAGRLAVVKGSGLLSLSPKAPALSAKFLFSAAAVFIALLILNTSSRMRRRRSSRFQLAVAASFTSLKSGMRDSIRFLRITKTAALSERYISVRHSFSDKSPAALRASTGTLVSSGGLTLSKAGKVSRVAFCFFSQAINAGSSDL